MPTDSQDNPGSRMRSILSSGEEVPINIEGETPLARLPRKPQAQPVSTPASVKEDTSPSTARKTRAPEADALLNVKTSAGPSRVERTFRAFWTITGMMSLLVNGILLAVIIYLLMSINNLVALGDRKDLMILSGLYSNFQKMERASIVTSIPVDAQIPIDLTVPIQRTTQITLASDTTIANARVRINTATLNIDAPAQVILPSGTVLEVAMNFTVPVQGAVPVHIDVPVNIPLSQTELQPPFAGLQAVVRPFLCILEPGTLDLDGQPVCK